MASPTTMIRADHSHTPAPHAVAVKFVIYSSLVGAVGGLIQLAEVIAYKGLGASALSITLLTMAPPIANFTSLWWGKLLVGRDQSRILRAAAIGCGAVLASGMVLASITHFIALLLFYFIFLALTYTTENRALQQHIPATRVGRLFGIATVARTGLGALVAAGAGFYMDAHPTGYRHLFGGAAIVCAAGILELSLIPTARDTTNPRVSLRPAMLLSPLTSVIPLLRARPDFFRFEVVFMIYGMGYLMAMPVLPIFLVKTLGLDYATIGLARGGVYFALLSLGTLLFSVLYDRSTPHRLSAAVFFLLTFFPLTLIAAAHHQGAERLAFLYAAFSFFGVAMGGANLLWSLSSIRFAGHEDVGPYHSVHVAATGVRGLFAPLIGFALMSATSPQTALLTIAAVWLTSSIATIALRLWDIRTGTFRSLRSTPREARSSYPPDLQAHT
jgi:MFS family permease